MNSSRGDVADRTGPGEVLRLVTDGLADSGLQVHPPKHDGRCRLVIACTGARCTLAVNDWGDAEWDYCPDSGDKPDAKRLADVATALLTSQADDFPRLGGGYNHEGITLKGIVGLELKARGLDVDLAIYTDEDYFDAHAEIVVTSPSSEKEAKVFVTDQGCLTWTRDHSDETAAGVPEPDCGRITDPAAIAVPVVESVTRAMWYLRPRKPI